VEINYQPIGSGAGIRQVTERTVFFGASDGPMTDEQLKAAPGPLLVGTGLAIGLLPGGTSIGPAGDRRMTIAAILSIAAIAVVIVAGRRRTSANHSSLRL
jgi:hypothetical protein